MQSPCSKDVRNNIRFLIRQYNQAQTPRLYSLITQRLDLLQRSFLTVVCDMENGKSLDTAQGIWLDLLGKIIGLSRPTFERDVELEYFGFAADDRGFDQAPFASVNPPAQKLQGIRDEYYRRLLRMKTRYNIIDNSFHEWSFLYITAFGSVNMKETEQGVEVSINESEFPGLWDIAKDNGLLYRPLGVKFITPFDKNALSFTSTEIYRFKIIINPYFKSTQSAQATHKTTLFSHTELGLGGYSQFKTFKQNDIEIKIDRVKWWIEPEKPSETPQVPEKNYLQLESDLQSSNTLTNQINTIITQAAQYNLYIYKKGTDEVFLVDYSKIESSGTVADGTKHRYYVRFELNNSSQSKDRKFYDALIHTDELLLVISKNNVRIKSFD